MLTIAELRRKIEAQARNRTRNLAMLNAIVEIRGLGDRDPVPEELIVPPDASPAAARAAVERLVAERIAAHVAERGPHAGLIKVRRKGEIVEEPAAAQNWRGALRDLIRLASGGRGKPPTTPLVALLREARRRLGLGTKAFGQVYGSAAHAWLFGQTRPHGAKSAATLERIATDAGMDPELFLAGLRPCWGGPAGDRRRTKGSDYGLIAQGYAPPWLEPTRRARIDQERAASGLPALAALPAPLCQDLSEFIAYKSGQRPHLRQAPRGGWTVNAQGREAAFESFTSNTSRYLGWLLSTGFDPARLTLLVLVDEVLISAFADFVADRNGGAKNVAGELTTAAMTLANPAWGFISQQARAYHRVLDHLRDPVTIGLYAARFRELRDRPAEPEAMLETVWLQARQVEEIPPHMGKLALFREWLELQHACLVEHHKRWRQAADKQRRAPGPKATSPLVRLRPILDRPRPLDTVFGTIERMRMAAEMVPGPTTEWLELERAIALMILISAKPLRAENLRHLALHRSLLKHQAADAPPGYYDDSPNLVYFGHDPKHPELPRHWRIRLKVDALKNRGTTITEDHDVPLADFVQEPLTRWVEEVRPRTPDAMAGSKYLFTRVRERADRGRDGIARKLMPLTIDGLGMLMAKMTRLYLPDIVLPTGDSAEELEERLHWLRHVVATHMLKTGSSIDAVATALLDHHQTVQRVYAFVVPADFAEEHNKAIDAAFRSFRRFAKAA